MGANSVMALPPLPDGFKLEENKPAAPVMPALPEGFRLESEVPDLPTATQPPPMEEQAQQGRWGDFQDQAQKAFIQSFAADAQAIDYLADSEMAGELADYLYERGDEAASTLSNRAIEGASKKWVNEDGTLGDAWGDVDSWIGLAASGAGSLGAVIAGGGLTKAAVTIGVRGMAKKMGKEALEKGSKGDKVVGALSYGSQEGLMMGGSAGRAVEEEILAMPVELLVEAPAFQGAFEEMINAGMSETDAALAARETVARSAAVAATKEAATVGVMLGSVAGRWLDDAVAGRLANNAVKGAGIGALVEGGTEAAQGGSQQAIQNLNIATVDPNQEIMEGVANAAVSEGLAGGMAGAPLGAASGYLSPTADLTQDPSPFAELEIPEPDLPVEPAGELPGPEQPAPQPDFVVNPSGMAAASQQDIDGAYDLTRENAETPPLIETDYVPEPDYVASPEGEVMTPDQRTMADMGVRPDIPQIENQNIIYGEGPAPREVRNDAVEGEFPQGYNVDTYAGDQEFKALQDIEIKQVFTVDETGEQVEISERADRLFSRIDKRRNVLTKLLECVG